MPVIFENVNKKLGGRQVLLNFSFELEKGETFVIVGPSGTGKSVTLKHMIGVLTPDRGDIRVAGKSIISGSDHDKAEALRRFGVLFQSAALIGWLTVEQNIALPLIENSKFSESEVADRVARAIKMVHLEGAEQKKPSEISGGMQKRAGLARAIITEPDIILYDEPTSGLDPVMSRHIDDLILELQSTLGITSVVVTHDMTSAFTIADRIGMLHQGSFGIIATPQQFADTEIDYAREFVRSQFSSGKVKVKLT